MNLAGTYHGDFEFFNKLIMELKKVNAKSLQGFIAENLDLGKGAGGMLSYLYNGVEGKKPQCPEGFNKVEDYQEFKAKAKKIQPYKKSKEL